jgi:hypothetical protein
MVGRVNLNLPPRLIESARAAQYANREALGGRTLADKIKAKIKARRAAVVRAQPLTPDRAGGALEERDPLRWRIWRKRRPAGTVRNYTIEKSRRIVQDSTPPQAVIVGPQPQTDTIDTWTIYVEGDDIEGKQIYYQVVFSFNQTLGYDNTNAGVYSLLEGTEKSRIYLTTFTDPLTGNSSEPFFALIFERTYLVGANDSGNFGSIVYYLPWTKAKLTTGSESELFQLGNPATNPLQAWPSYLPNSEVNRYPPPNMQQITIPITPEYDISRISKVNGYETTITARLP